MNAATKRLHALALKWDSEVIDSRDQQSFRILLDELIFHSELRFSDYVQYSDTDGPFIVRLEKWLANLKTEREQQTLLRLLRWLIFMDSEQMRSLLRDAYRRIIVPWLQTDIQKPENWFLPDFHNRNLERLKRYPLFSITESFAFNDFIHVNNLSGISKPSVLGEKLANIRHILPDKAADIDGIIIFEDMVGTGRQAMNVLKEVLHLKSQSWRIVFIPLIILQTGSSLLRKLKQIETCPAMTIPDRLCLKREPVEGEPKEFAHFRALVLQTEKRVLEKLDELDDPPGNAFGYKNSGGLVVTSHNTPNNSLPLLHHKAPSWSPLFRRIHHSK